VRCSTIGQRLDEDAQLLQSGISTDTHPNDTQTKTIVTCTHTQPLILLLFNGHFFQMNLG